MRKTDKNAMQVI